MADDIDIASEINELFLQKALQEHYNKIPKVAEEFCIDCDIEIPELRRKHVLGVQRCIDCQEIHEVQTRK